MADTPSTGNTTAAVDQAIPSDTAQSTGETVQLAQAAAVVEVSAPPRGADVSLTVEPGQTVELKDPVLRFTQDGADLVIHWANLGETHTTLVDALAAGTPLVLADGTPLTFEQVLAQIPNLDPDAFTPAAPPPPALAAAGGAYNTPYDGGTMGPEHGIKALLLGTDLSFHLIEGELDLITDTGGALAAAAVAVALGPDECDDLRAEFDAAVAAYSAVYPDVKGLNANTDAIEVVDGSVDLGGDSSLGFDLWVGDVFVQTDDSIAVSLEASTSVSSSDNTFNSFNDLLDASGNSSDTVLVGDAFLNITSTEASSESELTLDASNSVSGGDNNLFNVFADDLRGGSGNDILVGDAFLIAPSSHENEINVDVSNRVTNGVNNIFNAFNDILDGGGGNDLLVGDFFTLVGGDDFQEVSVEVSNEVFFGDGNQFNVFDDGLIGGGGDDVLTGDFQVGFGPIYDVFGTTNDDSIAFSVDVSNFVEGGNDNSFFAFNDMLDGGAGNDFLVGDIFFGGGELNSAQIFASIDVRNTVNGGFYGEGAADNNSFTAFSDMLEGGDGSDVLVGDLYYDQETIAENDLDIDVSNRVDGEGGTADNNSFSVFDDILDGGPGADLLVGDIFVDKQTNSAMDHTINLSNSVTDGDNNTFSAFNDFLLAGTLDAGLPSAGVGDGAAATTNGTFATAQVIGRASFGIAANANVGDDSVPWVSIEGDIGFNDDVDIYRVELVAGETITMDIDFGSGGIAGNTDSVDTQLFLFDANGVLLAQNDDRSTSFGGGGSASILDAFLEFTASSSGVFFIGVTSFNNDPDAGIGQPFAGFGAGGSSGNYVLNVSIDDGAGNAGFGTSPATIAEVDFDVPVALDDGGFDFNTIQNHVLVGDYLIRGPDKFDGNNDIDIDLNNDITRGAGNTFKAFEDVMIGSQGPDLMVGDVMFDGRTNGGEGHVHIDVDISNNGGQMDVFGDHLCGNLGDDTLVGDLFHDNPADDPNLDVTNITGNRGGTVNAFNDNLEGASGDDLLVGDAFFDGIADSSARDADFTLDVSNVTGGTQNNIFNGFEDTLLGGKGEDTLVGDVYGRNGVLGSALLTALASGVGFDNTMNVFNDFLDAGEGNDPVVVGDVFIEGNRFSTVDILVTAEGNASGGSAKGHTVNAFNDTIIGDNLLVGDVLMLDSSQFISLKAVASGNGQVGHQITAFEDDITGGAGDDILVGDAARGTAGLQQFGTQAFIVQALGFADHMVSAFNDELEGEDGDDLLIGDAFRADGGTQFIVQTDGEGAHSISAFNDTLDGGDGDDVLIGDALSLDGNIAVSVTASQSNQVISAFNDELTGGDGEDVLIGDFVALDDIIDFDDILAGNVDLDDLSIDDLLGGLYTGALTVDLVGPIGDNDTLFNDTLDGGADSDVLWGQLGDDILTGGGGADIFFYANADNSSDLGDGNDTITDFSGPGGDGDFVLLDELFDALGTGTAAARAAAVSLDDTSDQGVGGAAIDTVLTITGQADFSITFQDVTLSDPTGGALTVADLAFLGIDVGS